MLQAALECAITYSKERQAFGSPIAKLQAIQVCIQAELHYSHYLTSHSSLIILHSKL